MDPVEGSHRALYPKVIGRVKTEIVMVRMKWVRDRRNCMGKREVGGHLGKNFSKGGETLSLWNVGV